MGMSSIFQGADKRWRYASIDENGTSVCRFLVSNALMEKEFVEFLPDQNPASYSLLQLEKLWIQFINTKKRERA